MEKVTSQPQILIAITVVVASSTSCVEGLSRENSSFEFI